MQNVISLILGGGKGTRLYPLTEHRSKPAVPLAGKYRLIDIPISNCINAGLKRIYLLTQFNSVSLHRHIRETYRFDRFDNGFVEILAAQQTIEQADWYQGTADAVRKNLRYLLQPGIEDVLILSGDQLYRMDYAKMLKTHRDTGADVTIAALPVTRKEARGFGIMRLNDDGVVQGFLEKPQTDKEIDMVRTDPEWIDAAGLDSRGRDCLASMGIYLFKRDVLVELLRKSDYQDFGKEVFPMSIRTRHVQVHLFDSYWEDIGTIRSFFDANIDLAKREPAFDLSAHNTPIYTQSRSLPPTIFHGGQVAHSLISDGCVIDEGAQVENSVIGLRCHIGRDVKISNSIVMGADFYETEQETGAPDGEPAMGIGHGTVIDHAIIDKNCRIGANVVISPEGVGPDRQQTDKYVISDGILVARKGAVFPDGWRP